MTPHTGQFPKVECFEHYSLEFLHMVRLYCSKRRRLYSLGLHVSYWTRQGILERLGCIWACVIGMGCRVLEPCQAATTANGYTALHFTAALVELADLLENGVDMGSKAVLPSSTD